MNLVAAVLVGPAVADPAADMPATVVFDSEAFETFELAPQRKPFSTYSRSHFKRSP